MRYWLMKTEPSVFSMGDLERLGQSEWEGVRNYQARNFMREMSLGDRVFIYHSNTAVIGIYGIGVIVGEAKPDPFQFDPQSDYFEPRASKEKPIWDLVTVGFERLFIEPITLNALKSEIGLGDFALVQRGNRLSVMPVTAGQWGIISGLGGTV